VLVDKLLRSQEIRLTDLPFGPCPAHPAVSGFDAVEAVLQSHGGQRTVRISVPEASRAIELLNQSCGLFPVSGSYSAALQPSQVRRGHVALDLSMSFTGSRDTELLSVAAAPGIRAHVVEKLPLTVAPDTSQLLPHVLTLVLDVVDCAALKRASDAGQPPGDVVLSARRPGEPAERLVLSLPAESTDTFVAGCGIPPAPVLLAD
jgi:hypothetical protein